MMHSSKKSWIVGAGLVSVLLLSACSGTGGGDSSGEADAVLRYGAAAPLNSFAPWEARWAGDVAFLQPVYDTLLRADPDGTLTPGLATEWAWDEALTTLTMTLRDDVTFSDG